MDFGLRVGGDTVSFRGCGGGERGGLLDYVGAADTLAVPVVYAALFELEFHVFDAFVDDAVAPVLASIWFV